ncbi:MAG: SCO family protein [Acidimicrobiales bacterium]
MSGRVFYVTGGALAVVIVVVAVLLGVTLASRAGTPGLSSSLSNLMGLDKLLKPRPAPGFTLTDQNGKTVSLAGLRGKVVVLEFMDPHCTDICPIVSQEFRQAYKDLPASARDRVAFVAVNVNRYNESVADMRAYTDEQRLYTVPTWHFVTGSTPALERTWSDYGVYVYAPGPKADVVHTSVVYWISPNGMEEALASPVADHHKNGSAFLPAGQESAWARGIATEAVAFGA